MSGSNGVGLDDGNWLMKQTATDSFTFVQDYVGQLETFFSEIVSEGI
jgi:hypothetical protein